MRQISEGPFEGIAALGSGKKYTCLLCFTRASLRGRVTGADSNLYEHMRAHHGLNIGTVAGVYLATRKRFDELARAIQAADAVGAKRAWDALRAHKVRTCNLTLVCRAVQCSTVSQSTRSSKITSFPP
jgi:hypothetical protein